MRNPAPGFVLLIVLAGCAVEAPMAPDEAPIAPIPEPSDPVSEPAPEPLRPEAARDALASQGVPYSKRAFFTAAEEGAFETVKLFVEAGMDVNDPDEEGNTVLMRAALGGHLRTVRYLLEQGNSWYINAKSDYCAGDLTTERTIEMTPADVRCCCNRPNALMFAAFGGHLDVAEYLLEQGASWRDMGFVDYRLGPNSALHLAAYAGHVEVVEHIVVEVATSTSRYGKYINSGHGAMGWAAQQGHLDVVRFLYESGVSIETESTGRGTTALMMAAYGGQPDVVRFLLDHNANIHVRETRQGIIEQSGVLIQVTEYGASALTAAIDQGHDEVMALLLDHWLITYGADGRDPHGRTTLMYAASWGNIEWMQTLVDNDAPVGAQTAVGTTALMFAAAAGHVEAVQFLLDSGEDPSIENRYGYTALLLAQERGHEEVVNLLNSAA